MPIDTEQWRASTGLFCASRVLLRPPRGKQPQPKVQADTLSLNMRFSLAVLLVTLRTGIIYASQTLQLLWLVACHASWLLSSVVRLSCRRLRGVSVLLALCLVVVQMLLIMSGDVEENPGPPKIQTNVLGENDLRCVFKELLDVSHKWFNLGLELELSVGTLERIREQYPDLSTALREMLLHWLKTVDPPPTWEGLACALESHTVGEPRLAEQLRTEYCRTEEAAGGSVGQTVAAIEEEQPSHPSRRSRRLLPAVPTGDLVRRKPQTVSSRGRPPLQSGLGRVAPQPRRLPSIPKPVAREQAPSTVEEEFTQTNQAMIRGKFACLLEFVEKKLQQKLAAEIIKCELRLFVIRLFNVPDSSIPVSSDVSVIFEAMRSHKLLTYLNIAGLEQIVEHFCGGDSEVKSKMEQYKKDRSGFELATKIKESDYILKARSKFSYGSYKPSSDLQPKRTSAYLTALAVKLEYYVADYHLDYLRELWKLLSNVLSLPPLYLILDAVIMGSVLVVWLIPTDVVSEATERAKQNADFFKKYPILKVMIGEDCVYSKTEPTDCKGMAAESTTNLASDAFRKHYDTLYSALSSQPDTVLGLTVKLYKRVVITQDTRDSIQLTTGITPGHRASTLLLAVESSIRIDRRNLRKFVRILRKEPTLKSVADALQQSYRALVAELGQVDRSSFESETEGTEHQRQGKEYGEGEVTKAIEKFEIRFNKLVYRAQEEIEQSRTPVKQFLRTLMLLPLSIRHDHLRFFNEVLPNIVKSKSIDEIFLLLNLYWNFIDYHLLEVVITGHGSESLKAQMEKYVCDLAQFRRNTTIAQVCGIAKTWLLKQDLPQHFSKLTTKFSAKASEYTLQDLEDFRKSFFRELSLSESIAMLAGVVKGSVIILWHIPTAIASSLTTAILSHPRRFFEEQQLVEIDIDRQCLFSAQQTLRACVDDPSELSSLIPPLDGIEESVHEDEVEQPQEQLSIQEDKVKQPEEQLGERLLLACEEGSVEAVSAVLKQGTIPEEWLQTAMEMACENEHSTIINLLLNEQEKSVHEGEAEQLGPLQEQADGRDTPLMAASYKGDMKIVQCLLKAGALVNLQDLDGGTALMLAISSDHLQIASDLIQAGADVNIQTEHGSTALTLASEKGHHLIVQQLLQARADPNLQTELGSTALTFASKKGHHLIVQQLLQTGADPNHQNEDGGTALMLAISSDHLQIASDLIQAGADVNIQTEKGSTALTWASEKGHHLIVQQLLQAGADPNLQTENVFTALMYASRGSHHNVLRELLAARADVNLQNKNGETALIKASARGHHDVVRGLLAAGADVDVQNKNGVTALILAISWGHLEIASDLIQAGADVNIQDEEGDSALMVSAYKGHSNIVERLIKRGAEVNILNKDGLTPLQAAIQKHHTEVVRKLLDAGADINIAEKNTGWTALFFAAKEGEAEIIQLLLQRGADLTTVDKENVTALEIAQAQSHEESCRVLHDHLKSQQSLQTAQSDVSAGDTDRPTESQQSLQTEDKPPESQQSSQTTEVNTGDTDKPPESHRQQALEERIIRVNNYFKTLFKRLEENLLPSKTEKARAIREFQSFPSPHRQPSKRVRKGKRQSGKRSRAKTDDVNVRIL